MAFYTVSSQAYKAQCIRNQAGCWIGVGFSNENFGPVFKRKWKSNHYTKLIMALNFKRRDNLVIATQSSVGFLVDAQIWSPGKHNSCRILIHNPLPSVPFFFFPIFRSSFLAFSYKIPFIYPSRELSLPFPPHFLSQNKKLYLFIEKKKLIKSH
jgi:hypothetical protein